MTLVNSQIHWRNFVNGYSDLLGLIDENVGKPQMVRRITVKQNVIVYIVRIVFDVDFNTAVFPYNSYRSLYTDGL